MVEHEGARHRYCPDNLDLEVASERVPAISLHFTIVDPAVPDETVGERSFPVPVLICDASTTWIGDARIFVAEDAMVTPGDLADLIEAAIFCPSDDADDDSWETQRRDFRFDAFARANTILLGAEAAVVERIRGQLSHEVAWLVPEGKVLTATIRKHDIALTLADIAPAA